MLSAVTIRNSSSNAAGECRTPPKLLKAKASSSKEQGTIPSTSSATTTPSTPATEASSSQEAPASSPSTLSKPSSRRFLSFDSFVKKDKSKMVAAQAAPCCTICASLDFNVRDLTSSVGEKEEEPGQQEQVMATLPTTASTRVSSSRTLGSSSRNCETLNVPASPRSSINLNNNSHNKCAPCSASKKLQRFHNDLEKYCGAELPEVALLESKEVKLGKRLGKGGSASVYEVTGFTFGSNLTKPILSASNGDASTAFESIRSVAMDSIRGVACDTSTKSFLEEDDFSTSSSESSRSCPQLEMETQDELRLALKESQLQKHEKYVLKRLSSGLQTKLMEGDKYARACVINMMLEADFLRVIDHPNIVKLKAMGKADSETFLVMTCLPETMEQKIVSWRRSVKKFKRKQLQHSQNAVSNVKKWKILCNAEYHERQQLAAHIELRHLLYERMQVAQDVANAVAYLHGRGILYRDLKTSNIGFDSNGVVKLFDFGISRFLPVPIDGEGDLEDSFSMSKVGTKMFMAPEIMAKEKYNTKADVYSFGVLLWKLLALSTPTAKKKKPEDATTVAANSSKIFSSNKKKSSVADNTRRRNYDFDILSSNNDDGPNFEFPICPCWPSYMQSLLRRILQRNPKLRPTMEEIESKLNTQSEKLWREIERQEERLHAPITAAAMASGSPERKKKKLARMLFGSTNRFGRSTTYEIDFDNDHE